MDRPQLGEKLFAIFQVFTHAERMPVFLANIRFSVLNFLLYLKNICEKVSFFKTLKGRQFLLDGSATIIFLPVFRHLGALC